MNEVTKIHLGRQEFTISVDAHHELKSYLEAIKKQIKDKDVVEEIELRMAELLKEHGLNSNKVILPGDVDFLREQLGNPKDFTEEEGEVDESGSKQPDSKRLFRDTENAMIAGVAAGLAKYTGLDVLLVRLAFIVITIITAGWGILIYIALWLLVPEAKTSSERLLMAGKPVTVDSLKEIVERADMKGAAHRANATLATPINNLFRILLKIVGLALILSGLSALFGLVGAETYVLLHSGALLQDNIFPVGLREHLLLDTVMLLMGLVSIFIVLFGIAMFRRKWPIRTWVTGILIGLIFIGLAVGGALAAVAYPNIRDRYNANFHTTVHSTTPFNSVSAIGIDNGIDYETSDKYYVSLNYYDHPNLASIKISVKNGVLFIDSSQFNWHRNCQSICLPDTYDMTITVHSPNAMQFINQDGNIPVVPQPPGQIYKPY